MSHPVKVPAEMPATLVWMSYSGLVGEYPNSIRALSPTTPGYVALASLPVAAGVPFHSIIGDRGLGEGEHSSDGVVKYSSAHLSGASSELIVPADHPTYEHPEAIAEVNRILKVHLVDIAKNRDSHLAPKVGLR
jgi:hypothetical protein